jgi:peptide/nickel transport system permease protein
MKTAASLILATVFLASFTPVSYETQSRDSVSSPPSRQHILGTDDLGRDRASRLLYGTRISLLLAPCAALVTVIVAAAIGITAGFIGGWWETLAMRTTDLFLSLPWLFLFLILRALLPLNSSPAASLVLTFLLMGILGWAPAAGVIRSAVQQFRTADFVLQARACGCPEARIWFAWLAPRLRGILLTQFFLSIPIFILGEASLGILGLGVAEPMPSWGNLLRELTTAPPLSQYWIFAPVALLILVMTSFQLLLPPREQ